MMSLRTRKYTVVVKQNLLTAVTIAAPSEAAAVRIALSHYSEPEPQRTDATTRKLPLHNDQWLGSVAVHHVEPMR